MSGRVLRADVFRALDALELGDQCTAVEILLDALEHNDPNYQRAGNLPRCRICGQRAWPGDLRAHIQSRHDAHELETAA